MPPQYLGLLSTVSMEASGHVTLYEKCFFPLPEVECCTLVAGDQGACSESEKLALFLCASRKNLPLLARIRNLSELPAFVSPFHA